MRILVEDKNRVALLIATISSMLIVLVCLTSVAAIKTYYTAWYPPIVVDLGIISMSVGVTNRPECSPLMPGCPQNPPQSRTPQNRNYLTVWVAITTPHNGGLRTSARMIFMRQVR